MFQPGNPERDIQWGTVRDGSDASRSSASEYDCTPFGRDYEPLPLFVKPASKWPAEDIADDFEDSYKTDGRGTQPREPR